MDKGQINQMFWIISALLFIILMLGLWIRGNLSLLKTLRNHKLDRLRYYERQASATEGTLAALKAAGIAETETTSINNRMYLELCKTKIEAYQSFPI